MVEWIKHLPLKPDLSSNLRAHVKVGGESQFHKVVLRYPISLIHTYTLTLLN